MVTPVGSIRIYFSLGAASCDTDTTIKYLSSSVFAVKEPVRWLCSVFCEAVSVIVYVPLLLLKLLTVSHVKPFVMTHGFPETSSIVSDAPPATNGETITVSPCAVPP